MNIYEKLAGAVARFLSAALSPLLMPTYGIFLALWVSVLCYLPVGVRMVVTLVVLGITCMLPMAFIAVLHNAKVITDKRLANPRERWLPYLFTLVCYIAATLYVAHVHSPAWLWAFMAGSAVAVLVQMTVTVWWKISAHAAGMGGLLALLMAIHNFGLEAFPLMGTLCVAILLCGCLCSARIYLERHSFWQALAGVSNSFVCVYTAMKIFG